MDIEIRSVVDVAILFLTQLHEYVFGSKIVPVREASYPGLVARLQGKRSIAVFRNTQFEGLPDDAAGTFIQGDNFLDIGLDGAYCFTSVGVLRRLDVELAYLFSEHLNGSFGKRDVERIFAYLDGSIFGCLIHEMRHEAQIYENVSLRKVSGLDGVAKGERENLMGEWCERLAYLQQLPPQEGVPQHLLLAREEDAFVAEFAATFFWQGEPWPSQAGKMARAKEIILG